MQQLGIFAGGSVLDGVQPGGFIKIDEFVIGLDALILADGRDHPLDLAGDPGRTEVAQDADTLVAFLDIEIAQIFIAGDGFPDAGGA